MKNFANLVEETESDFWVIAIYDHKYPENTGYYGVNANCLSSILRVKDMAQILRLVRTGKKLSYTKDFHFTDYELSRDRQDWSSEDIVDFHVFISNEFSQGRRI